MPYMNTLSASMSCEVNNGYIESFKVTQKGLYAISNGRFYRPEQIQSSKFYRFEGESNPDDNAIMYVIEAYDGTRGTLVDAYGICADSEVSKFMKQVEEIRIKRDRYNQQRQC